jgi:RNA polymerase sigma-70 factor (ECF subfamily)
VSYAFLLALEELSATQRSIVILRDVLDYSVRETADLLGTSEANVKTAHHRARAKLEEGYERERPRFDEQAMAVARGAMMRFFAHLALGDREGLEQLLAANVVGLNDGAGEFFAAQRPITTPERVARFFHKLAGTTRVVGSEPRVLNGMPAIVAQIVPDSPRIGPRSANLFAVDDAGRITRIYTVVATRKLGTLLPR